MTRSYRGDRRTKETDIELILNLDGKGQGKIATGIGFFDHMLEQIMKHGQLDLELKAVGDIEVDFHHTVEDVGILMGKAIAEALGDKKGIVRYATAFIPMDEALSMVSMDISGRPFLQYGVNYSGEFVGQFEVQLVEEFFRALAFNSGITLHIQTQYGRNNHHIVESIFKAFAKALREAITIDPRIEGVLSTKGSL
ncbi:Imidazoleglycerol-phosphate dehydratase [Alkaliphilus metalliredigens QYMF]|uniref:Imidazoleglycerol-phosphate dehydratase n=1 Tax=Alkaliphilus metalliredigens (strain QYMF) TaxID=293826 RepID=HIS7_ALKMQ|nr:imidazoleglycerol-phosphate dehydratase HisB [Alkaliphilus metalliredigens]A6TKT3.1 RecName: Full=Imidazoleglycerol-phosphate dehydratase; Short=IGPD [Alkaliphilus metalliredigens QYMF]ABR46801.1 Imidazoleglycerol-phosphate dehydratase [Alkaliphilus metalliredigens QYMF]